MTCHNHPGTWRCMMTSYCSRPIVFGGSSECILSRLSCIISCPSRDLVRPKYLSLPTMIKHACAHLITHVNSIPLPIINYPISWLTIARSMMQDQASWGTVACTDTMFAMKGWCCAMFFGSQELGCTTPTRTVSGKRAFSRETSVNNYMSL